MPDLAMLDYFYGDEAEQFTFYRIPKVLFTDPSYRRISSDAKILYGLMEKKQKNPKIYKGKQSVKHLVRQGAGVSNIEITDGNIKSFEKVARKYGIDFALKKDASTQSPRYLVFFKSKDADALTAAFREYSGKVVKSQSKEKPSIRKQLSKLQEVVKDMAKSLSRNKSQEVDR